MELAGGQRVGFLIVPHIALGESLPWQQRGRPTGDTAVSSRPTHDGLGMGFCDEIWAGEETPGFSDENSSRTSHILERACPPVWRGRQ